MATRRARSGAHALAEPDQDGAYEFARQLAPPPLTEPEAQQTRSTASCAGRAWSVGERDADRRA